MTEKFSQQVYNVSGAKYIFVIWFIFLALSSNIDLKMKSEGSVSQGSLTLFYAEPKNRNEPYKPVKPKK